MAPPKACGGSKSKSPDDYQYIASEDPFVSFLPTILGTLLVHYFFESGSTSQVWQTCTTEALKIKGTASSED